MAERTAASPYTRPIVADPEASLSHRPLHARRPRLWPLWCLCLLLIMALSALAAAGWWQSQQLEQHLERLQGELSNMHARLDGEQDGSQEQGDAVSRLAARFDRFESGQGRREEDVEARLASVTEAFERVETRLDQQAGSVERDQFMEDARNHHLASLQASVDTLEQTGDERRAALREAFDKKLSVLSERQQSQQETLSQLTKESSQLTQLDERLESAERALQQLMKSTGPEHQANMERRIEGLETRFDKSATDSEKLSQQMNELTNELRDIRQSQLVINAKLEGMAP